MICPFHTNREISLICIAQHKCQRKLCVRCQDEHDRKSTMSIEKFVDLITMKIQGQKLPDQKSKQRMELKQIIANSEMTFKNLQKELTSSIQQIFDQIEQEDQQYTLLLNKNPNLAESSYADLEQLVQILNGKNLNDWDTLKKSYANQISSIKYQLEQNINIFSEKVKEQIKQISLIFKTKQSLFKWNVEVKEFNSLVWDSYYQRFNRTSFSIAFTDNQEIQYIKDGQTLRIDQVKDTSTQPQMMNNLEQIKHLNWSGNYGQNNQKIGRWKATWKGVNLDNVGGEYIDGKKQGQWKDLIQNYWSKAQVYEIGKYEKDIRRGVWEFVQENKKIGGGKYNDAGNKQGQWVDIFQNFSNYAQITYNDREMGYYLSPQRWDKILVQNIQIQNGGQQDEQGNQLKIGKWVELDEEFNYCKQVTFNGQYNKKGMKVGRWDIMYCKREEKEYKQIIFKSRSYDQEGNQKKIGKWVELDEGFHDGILTSKQVTYNGEYNMNNVKVGRWDIMYCKSNEKEYKQIGGVSYDQKGTKFGQWIEVGYLSYITFNDEYNMKGQKVGIGVEMDIQEHKKRGEGRYD